MDKNILILISSSWGEIEMVAPVCKYLKENTESKVTVLFLKIEYDEILRGNDLMYNIMKDCSHEMYNLSDFLDDNTEILFGIVKPLIYSMNLGVRVLRRATKNSIRECFYKSIDYKGLMDKLDPGLIIKDTSMDIEYSRKKIINMAKERDIKTVMISHSPSLHSDVAINTSNEYDADLLLCTSEYHRRCALSKNIRSRRVVGIPKFDGWWNAYLKDFCDIDSVYKNDYRTMSRDKRLVLFFTRNVHPGYLSKESFDYIMKGTIDTVLKDEDAFLIIKTHPRQIKVVQKYLKKYDKSKWVVEQASIHGYIGYVSLVISMWSTVLYDALNNGKPVIEFHRFEDTGNPWVMDNEGRYMTGKESRGMVAPARTVEELEYYIEQFKLKANTITYFKNFRKYFPDTYDGATKEVVDILLEEMSG